MIVGRKVKSVQQPERITLETSAASTISVLADVEIIIAGRAVSIRLTRKRSANGRSVSGGAYWLKLSKKSILALSDHCASLYTAEAAPASIGRHLKAEVFRSALPRGFSTASLGEVLNSRGFAKYSQRSP